MENNKKTKEEEFAAEALKNVPSEVQDFMTSALFEAIVNAAQQTLSLPFEQKGWIRLLSCELLMTTMTEKEAFQFLIDHGVSGETALKIIYIIDTEILTRAQNITEFFTDDVEVTEEEVQNYIETKPMTFAPNSLQSLAERLKQTSGSNLTTRDYTLQKGIVPSNLPVTEETPASPKINEPMDTISEPIAPSAPASAPEVPISKSFDPYHESIDK